MLNPEMIEPDQDDKDEAELVEGVIDEAELEGKSAEGDLGATISMNDDDELEEVAAETEVVAEAAE
jgi:hypothetical protein